jgi:hypothetical protein
LAGSGVLPGVVGGAVIWVAIVWVGRGRVEAALARVEEPQKEAAEYDARLKAWLGYFSRSEEETGVRGETPDSHGAAGAMVPMGLRWIRFRQGSIHVAGHLPSLTPGNVAANRNSSPPS